MDNESCYAQASHASCDAMSELALKEYYADVGVMSRMLDDASCFRYQSLANRGLESTLQKGIGLSKNSCFTKTDQFNAGPWEKQVMGVDMPTFYEQWTRARNNGKWTCGPPTEVCMQGPPIDACIWGNNGIEKCGKGCEPLVCTLGTSSQSFKCPTECGTYPWPCPNPIGQHKPWCYLTWPPQINLYKSWYWCINSVASCGVIWSVMYIPFPGIL